MRKYIECVKCYNYLVEDFSEFEKIQRFKSYQLPQAFMKAIISDPFFVDNHNLGNGPTGCKEDFMSINVYF